MPLENIHSILFDLDNTLVDSDLAYEKALRAVHLSQDHPGYVDARSVVKERLGEGSPSARSRILYFKAMLEKAGKFSAQSILDLIDEYEVQIQADFKRQWRELKRAKLFSDLSAKNIKMGIITNETARTQLIKLRALDPQSEFFKMIVTSEEVGEEKPSPKIFYEALRRMQTKAENLLIVGDQLEFDILPALKMGIHAVWTKEFSKAKNSPGKQDLNSGILQVQALDELWSLLR